VGSMAGRLRAGRYAHRMTDHTQSLLREALSLSEKERADLVAELLVSLEGPPEGDDAAVEQAWADELGRRARRVLAGESHGEDWDQLRDRVRSALTDG
jgi:putative addiction module component (TIGR02574 family)